MPRQTPAETPMSRIRKAARILTGREVREVGNRLLGGTTCCIPLIRDSRVLGLRVRRGLVV